MARRWRDDLHVTAGEEHVRRDHKRVGLIASEHGKSDLYLTAIPRARSPPRATNNFCRAILSGMWQDPPAGESYTGRTRHIVARRRAICSIG